MQPSWCLAWVAQSEKPSCPRDKNSHPCFLLGCSWVWITHRYFNPSRLYFGIRPKLDFVHTACSLSPNHVLDSFISVRTGSDAGSLCAQLSERRGLACPPVHPVLPQNHKVSVTGAFSSSSFSSARTSVPFCGPHGYFLLKGFIFFFSINFRIILSN